jgi:hypothetical protein
VVGNHEDGTSRGGGTLRSREREVGKPAERSWSGLQRGRNDGGADLWTIPREEVGSESCRRQDRRASARMAPRSGGSAAWNQNSPLHRNDGPRRRVLGELLLVVLWDERRVSSPGTNVMEGGGEGQTSCNIVSMVPPCSFGSGGRRNQGPVTSSISPPDVKRRKVWASGGWAPQRNGREETPGPTKAADQMDGGVGSDPVGQRTSELVGISPSGAFGCSDAGLADRASKEARNVGLIPLRSLLQGSPLPREGLSGPAHGCAFQRLMGSRSGSSGLHRPGSHGARRL